METACCQSCAMPLTNPEEIGTEKDGTKSADYCIYCYKDGEFTEELTMEECIDKCTQYLAEYNEHAGREVTLDEAKAMMRETFPKLKRWRRS
ncbi:MAG: zinc ribbon domain-containing protein [Alistipes sp.]|nr:zinc ribbon domain-containing protein [Alistipes sp.]MCD8102883.1 zinc ribbon domain-containing protein [Alistipes sp.]MCD8171888.1 zinc ribbon domain-containing protein [Alistipes sp.]